MNEDWPADEQVADIDEDSELQDEVEETFLERCQDFAVMAFTAVLYPFSVTATTVKTFLDNWLTSRPTRLILWGLPAAIVLFGAGYLALALGPPPSELVVEYREAAALAAETGDIDAAGLWLEKTLQLNPMDSEHRHNLALAAAQIGQAERAREIISSLAPEHGLGYPPAHFWMAHDLMQREMPLSPATARRVEHHLLQSLSGDQNQAEAHAILGQLYLDRNEVTKAIHHLQQAAPARPDSYFQLAQALRAAGRADEALEPATLARDYFRQQTQEDPLEPDHRRGWAFSEQLLGNHAEAVRILEAGLDSAEPEKFHQSLVDVYINWHNAEVVSGRATLAWQLELLSRALIHGPQDPRLLTLLAKLAVQDWEQADEAFAMLKELVARGVAPATVHLIIGTQSLKRGNFDDARVHLELANDRNPETPATLNNLAWLLAHQDDPDLEQALELAEAAKRLSPRAEICETVGTILALMGRNREAIKEFETALRGLSDTAELHSKLADAYEAIGDRELARVHRRLAQPKPSEP